MRVFICGIDGYLGWSLACHLAQAGHIVGGMDNGKRREWVAEVGGCSAIPIESFAIRSDLHVERWDGDPEGSAFAYHLGVMPGDLCDYDGLKRSLQSFCPDAIVHLAEMPSAPFSLKDVEHAILTHNNNVNGSLNLLWAMREVCPLAHLVKLGTMGEYGTPDTPIPEGMFPEGSYWGIQKDGEEGAQYKGDLSGLMFPRMPASFYHATKVHDTVNTHTACRFWGLRSTDIMQGVVYGTQIDAFGGDPRYATRFDFDECFGTAINRFCAQAVIGHPLTVYGKGEQVRGFLPLRDSMQCLQIAIENPPKQGEYRVFNQFEESYAIVELARSVQQVAADMEMGVDIAHYDNPRVEAPKHRYEADHSNLFDLGYKPTDDLHGQIEQILTDLKPHADRIESHRACIEPKTQWAKKEIQYSI